MVGKEGRPSEAWITTVLRTAININSRENGGYNSLLLNPHRLEELEIRELELGGTFYKLQLHLLRNLRKLILEYYISSSTFVAYLAHPIRELQIYIYYIN